MRRNQYEDEEDFFDIANEMSEGYVIEDITRGGYDISRSGRFWKHVESVEKAAQSIMIDMRKSGYYPNVFFVNDHGNVDLIVISETRRGIVINTIKSWV